MPFRRLPMASLGLRLASKTSSNYDTVLQDKKEEDDYVITETRWRSLRVIYFVGFSNNLIFTICISSLWPFLRNVDPEKGEDFLGWIVTSFSLAAMIFSPIFGVLSNFMGKCKNLIIFSSCLLAIGSILYAFTEDMPVQRGYYIIFTRAVLGASNGISGVLRSYISAATTLEERTSVTAKMSAITTLGIILGPAIQAACAPLGYPGVVNVSGFHLNVYTAPGFIGFILGVINMLLLQFGFTECNVPDNTRSETSSTLKTFGSTEALTQDSEGRSINYIAVTSAMYMLFVVFGLFTFYETIITPVVMHMFMWNSEEASMYVGITWAVGAALSIMVALALILLTKSLDERIVLIGALILCCIPFTILIPFGNEYPVIKIPAPDNATLSFNDTLQLNKPYVMVAPDAYATSGGCPTDYKWCHNTHRIYLSQHITAALLLSIGFATSYTLLFTLFSKILGSKPQGTLMGLFVASAFLARALAPVCTAQLYKLLGPIVSFSSAIGIGITAVVLSAAVFRQMAPFKE